MADLISAVAQSLRTIRVTFDGALDSTALDLSNWSFQPQPTSTEPAAAVEPYSVNEISSTVFDVDGDDDFTPGATYQITAKPISEGGITGVADSPANKATFTGINPAAPAERHFTVTGMIPAMNKREDDSKDLIRFLNVLEDPLKLLLNAIDRWTDIIDYDLAPDAYLDLMLRDLGFPIQIELTTIDKRRLLSVLVTLIKQKGTVPGIVNGVRFFVGYESDVLWPDYSKHRGGWRLDVSPLGDGSILGRSWYDEELHGSDISSLTGGRPYDFIVKVGKPEAASLTAEEEEKIRAIVEFARPSHTRLRSILSALPPPTGVVAVAGSGQVQISWQAVAAAVGYAIFWNNTPSVTTLSENGAVDPDNVSPYIDSAAPVGEKRFYTVAARDASGRNGVGSTIVQGEAE